MKVVKRFFFALIIIPEVLSFPVTNSPQVVICAECQEPIPSYDLISAAEGTDNTVQCIYQSSVTVACIYSRGTSPFGIWRYKVPVDLETQSSDARAQHNSRDTWLKWNEEKHFGGALCPIRLKTEGELEKKQSELRSYLLSPFGHRHVAGKAIGQLAQSKLRLNTPHALPDFLSAPLSAQKQLIIAMKDPSSG
ncbi:hypothetical protein F5876DRAFT_70172 [Lentinula aff. lateritia]|uniref:Uncharacterized protein n=1 Tax=Lentinula aff. lateritia TaxID=2804960 RepID=A0ACC1TJP9_9AGAR|nr:hypothetical protein F5876DRAFT_70172 [Lentinula aff. lateritia]